MGCHGVFLFHSPEASEKSGDLRMRTPILRVTIISVSVTSAGRLMRLAHLKTFLGFDR